jgi:hypothetical protein
VIANVDPDNGVAYGYIGAAALDPELVDELLYNPLATDYTYDTALEEYLATERRAEYEAGRFNFDRDFHENNFANQYEASEHIVEGEHDEVQYRSSWLGGALHFFILKSPFVTDYAGRASPCVPNAGTLDNLTGSVKAYDVPFPWRA